MKNAAGTIVTVVIVLGVAYWTVSSLTSKKQAEPEKQAPVAAEQMAQAETHLQIKKSMEDLAAKFNAVTDWHQDFDFNRENEGLFGPYIYTIEIEDALVRADKKPVMFIAHIEDVRKRETGYSLHLSTSDPSDPFAIVASFPPIRFILDCTQEHVNQVMQNPRRDAGLFERANYAVIAEISGVRKVSYQLTAHADSVVLEDEYSFDVDIRTNLEPSNVFAAKGRCLDVLFIGDFGPEDLLETIPE